MKHGFKTPSFKKSISVRFSTKRGVKKALGLGMPRGTGWITNSKKYVYKNHYHRTTFGLGNLFGTSKRAKLSNRGCLSIFMILIGFSILITFPSIGIIVGIGFGVYYILRNKKNKGQVEIEEERVYLSSSGVSDNSPKVNLTEWFNKEFTKEELDYMEEKFQPLGGVSGLRVNIMRLPEKSVLGYLTNLSGWFDNPRDRELALKLINKAEEYVEKGTILDKHFFWSKKMELYYKLRDTDSKALDIAIQSAQKQIDLAPKAAVAFLRDGFGKLPSHTAYTQLAIIFEKQGKYDEAITLVKQAESQGWNGDWDKRIERLEAKKVKKFQKKKA